MYFGGYRLEPALYQSDEKPQPQNPKTMVVRPLWGKGQASRARLRSTELDPSSLQRPWSRSRTCRGSWS